MTDRKLFPDSRMPMTDEEHGTFLEARARRREELYSKGWRDHEKIDRLSRGAGERAVQRVHRVRPVPVEERQPDLFAARR